MIRMNVITHIVINIALAVNSTYIHLYTFVNIFTDFTAMASKNSKIFIKINHIEYVYLRKVCQQLHVSKLLVLVRMFMCFSHCGLQSTVVNSRVRHTHIPDWQRNWAWGFVEICMKSFLKFFFTAAWSSREFTEHVNWESIGFMLVPVKIRVLVTGTVSAVKFNHLMFRSCVNSCELIYRILCVALCQEI